MCLADTLGFCWYGAVALRIATAVPTKESRCVHTLRTSLTPWVFVVTEDMHLSRVMSPSEIQRLAEDVVMRSGQATPTAPGGNLSKKYDEQLTSSTLSSAPSDQFYDTMEISNSTAIQVESASMREPRAYALYGPGCENITFGLESQESSIKNTISEEMARSELEAMERDVMISNSKIAVREYQRQARDAVNQAVRQS